MGKTEKDLANIVFTVFGEIPAMILACIVVDESKYFGRKKTVYIFFAVAIVANLASFFNIGFAVSLAVSRFCYREVSSMLYTYTTEVY